MKKLSLGLVVCALASVAYGVPSFVINNGEPIVIPAVGAEVTVPVSITGGAGGIGGMILSLEISPVMGDPEDPFTWTGFAEIEALDVIGAGTIFAASNTGQTIFSKVDATAPGVMAQGAVTTASGTLANTTGVAGFVTLKGYAVGAGQITTDAPVFTSSVMLNAAGDSMGYEQSTVPLMVLPEPVSGLLLLAGLPLLRRRRA